MSWSEDDSAHFIDEGKYFVPEREAQIATICAAIPPLAGAGHRREGPCGVSGSRGVPIRPDRHGLHVNRPESPVSGAYR